jgi:Uma2 family endonuclease
MALVRLEQPKVTYADLEAWPDDGRRYELYDGEVYVCPAPRPRHQLALAKLHDRLQQYAERHGGLALLSPIDIVFDQHNVLQPDIAFFEAARRHHVKLDEAIRVPPDVVVEVISPSTVWNDLGRKKATFARFGVPEYWLLDPHIERIERHSLSAAAYERTLAAGPQESFESIVLGGFTCRVAALFPW